MLYYVQNFDNNFYMVVVSSMIREGSMKNKIAVFMCGMLLFMCVMPGIHSTTMVEPFEKKDFPFDVRLDIRFTTKNNITIPLHSHMGPLTILLFNFLDIRSFSLYEITDTPEYLYASMEVSKFKYSEYRSVYIIYWCYNGTEYYAATYTHSLGEYVCIFCGYWEEDHTIYHHTIIEGDIHEEENRITWKIPRNLIGDPNNGAVLQNIHAASHLQYQKDCGAPRQLCLASDYVKPIFDNEYTYTIQV